MDFIALLPWEMEGITSPCSLLIGQYRYHMTLCPCYGIHLFSEVKTNTIPSLLLFLQLTIDWEKIRAKIALEEESGRAT